MITADQVQTALVAALPARTEDSNNVLGLLGGLLLSLAATAALTAGGLFWLAPSQFDRAHAAAAILLGWLLCYLVGYLVKDTMGLADPFYKEATQAQNSWLRRDSADDWMMMGCLLAILQFFCGSIYVCLHSLWRSVSPPGPAIPLLATPLLTVMANQSGRTFSVPELYEILRDGNLRVGQKELQGTLRWLATGGWVSGSLASGFLINLTRLGM